MLALPRFAGDFLDAASQDASLLDCRLPGWRYIELGGRGQAVRTLGELEQVVGTFELFRSMIFGSCQAGVFYQFSLRIADYSALCINAGADAVPVFRFVRTERKAKKRVGRIHVTGGRRMLEQFAKYQRLGFMIPIGSFITVDIMI